MSGRHTYQVLIVGAGLAGLAMAEALLDVGFSGPDIGIAEAGPGPATEASGGSGFLLNPLPGRSLVPKPGYLDAIAQAGPWLERLQARAGDEEVLFKGSLLRLLLDDHKVSRRLQRSYHRAQDALAEEPNPAVALQEHDDAATQRLCPWLAEATRAIEVAPSYALWPEPALKAQTRWLQSQGVTCHWEHRVLAQQHHPAQSPHAARWALETSGGALYGEHVVLAMGAAPDALLGAVAAEKEERVGGALLVVTPPEGPRLGHTLSGVGIHVAPRPDGRWVVGSTYDPPGEEPKTDAESIAELQAKAAVYLPQIYDCEIEALWRGQRLIMADTRMPIVGPAPGPPRRWVLGAFASKGLLLIPDHARRLAALLRRPHDAAQVAE